MTDAQPPIPSPTPEAVQPVAPVAAPKGKALPVVGAILAGIAFLTAIIPGPSFSTWFWAIPAIIISIIALTRKFPLRGLSIAAIIVAPIAWLIAIIVSIVFIVSGASSTNTSGSFSDTPSESSSSAAPSPSKSSTPPPSNSISGGDHVVGPDFAAGQYRAEVKKGLIQLCSVSQTIDGTIADIRVVNDGSVIFTVQDVAGSVVSFSGCQNIGLAANAIRANPSPITNGDWLVGSELPTGQYKGTVDDKQAVKLGSITQSNGKDVIDVQVGNEGDVIFTVQDLAGTVASFSGLVNITKVG